MLLFRFTVVVVSIFLCKLVELKKLPELEVVAPPKLISWEDSFKPPPENYIREIQIDEDKWRRNRKEYRIRKLNKNYKELKKQLTDLELVEKKARHTRRKMEHALELLHETI